MNAVETSASDSFTTMALYKFTYLLTYLLKIVTKPLICLVCAHMAMLSLFKSVCDRIEIVKTNVFEIAVSV